MKQFITALLFFICLKVFSQQPIANWGGYLYSLDVTNCNIRDIINLNFNVGFLDIAFTPNGKLWGIGNDRSGNDGLFMIDTTNSSVIYIGKSYATGGVSLVGLNDTILLAEADDSLWKINVTNAQSYNIGNIGYYADGDLAWYGNDLYMISANNFGGILIKIVLDSAYTTVLSSTQLNNDNNTFARCTGLATASLNGSDSLVAFGDGNSWILSPVDGSASFLCVTGANNGATSMYFPGILPITLLSFTYTLLYNSVNVQWQTATEINSDYFLIQRSTDGSNFTTIGKQPAAKNSSTIKQYSFIDKSPLSTRGEGQGVRYYRLKEVDKDGKFIYSKILVVKFSTANALTILQNPVQSNLQVQIITNQSQINSLNMFDFSGRRIKTFNIQNGLQTIDVSSLSKGTYFLQLITANGQIFNARFIKE